jgi:signal transduction histidine kinase/ActR/RegA family two-component response regulator
VSITQRDTPPLVHRDAKWVSAKFRALFSVGLADDCSLAPERTTDLAIRLDQLEVPIAYLGVDGAFLINETWQRTCGRKAAAWARSSLRPVACNGVGLYAAKIPRGAGDEPLEATLLPTYGARQRSAIALIRPSHTGYEARVRPPYLAWGGLTENHDHAEHGNSAFRELVSVPIGDSWKNLIHPSDHEVWADSIADAAQHMISKVVRLRLRSRGQSYRWHHLSVLVPRTSDRWLALAAACHDDPVAETSHFDLIEQLQAARHAAQRAEELKDRVIGIVSHELRAPVMTMLLWERVLRDSAASGEARFQALDAIHQSAQLQSRLVGDLLDLSRATSGKLHIELRLVDIGTLVADAVAAALPSALAKRIKLTHEGGEAGTIPGDASRLRQIIDNLLSNAIKFTEPGGAVKVALMRRNRSVTITVTDNGRGIEPDLRSRVFEPFNQGYDAIARRNGGLGLGLAIAKQIVDLHRGTLTAHSEGRGKGTTMTVVLPTTGRRDTSPPAGAVQSSALQGAHLLVVDDDERVRSALMLLLQRTGARVSVAESAVRAREIVSSQQPDALISDISMPEEDGHTLIKSLRAAGHRLPAIALTAFASQADAMNAVAAGFDLHVAKPVDFERLVSSLSSLLASRATAT